MELKRLELLSPFLGELNFQDKCLKNLNRAFLEEIDYLAFANTEYSLKLALDKLGIRLQYGICDKLEKFIHYRFEIYLEVQKDHPFCIWTQSIRHTERDPCELWELLEYEEEHMIKSSCKFLHYGRIPEFRGRIEDHLNNKTDFSKVGKKLGDNVNYLIMNLKKPKFYLQDFLES